MVTIIISAIAVFAIAIIMAMTGWGGGNFYVPVLVAAGSTMHQAATTAQFILVATAMAAATALTGFLGHTIRGDFNPTWTIPLAIVAVVGGLLGGKFSIKTNPEHLKRIFAYSSLAAAVYNYNQEMKKVLIKDFESMVRIQNGIKRAN